MFVRRFRLLCEHYPAAAQYPFDQPVVRQTRELEFDTPVSFFAGPNGSGKSTLLEAVARGCGIHIWRDRDGPHLEANPYRESLHGYVRVEWIDGRVPGAFFSSGDFRHFARTVDQWAIDDRDVLAYYGGKSLMVRSHGESILAYLTARCARPGLYFMDEPETALSPQSQVALVRLVHAAARRGQAQFVIATHSPILLACPGAAIYSFERLPITRTEYAATPVVQLYREFLADPAAVLARGDA